MHHFEEPGRNHQDVSDSRQFWLPLDTYASVLDKIVITCVDLLFIHNNQVLLGKRNCHPANGWWVVGGRMLVGESPTDAVIRKAQEEANLTIGRSPIQFLGVYSTVFATRSQPPVENGLHSVNLLHAIPLSDDQRASLKLTSREYDEWIWVSPDTIEDVLDLGRPLDQVVHQMATDGWAAMG
jgi:ADP-ribose pyrophosphatase YjhB (NUDIX family)